MLHILPHEAMESFEDAEDIQYGDYLVIRGVRIYLETIVNPEFLRPENIQKLRDEFLTAKPFSHFVIDNLFNPKLLELVCEEFNNIDPDSWRLVESAHERTHRLTPMSQFGPATQLYMSTVTSGWFMRFLSQVTGVKGLIPDPLCHNGGLHEVRHGGFFDVHLDFNLHSQTLLRNEMILITYLNKNWRKEYGGSLELWDGVSHTCGAEIIPEFGRTALFKHGISSFHGHPQPIKSPNGMYRRSLANYYYTHANSEKKRSQQHWTLFYPNARTPRWFKLLYTVKYRILANSVGSKLLQFYQTIKKQH
jgi:2OG-Fe(II) oxygenase superfamily